MAVSTHSEVVLLDDQQRWATVDSLAVLLGSPTCRQTSHKLHADKHQTTSSGGAMPAKTVAFTLQEAGWLPG